MKAGNDIDWATGEALAMGSLMYQGKMIFYAQVLKRSSLLTSKSCQRLNVTSGTIIASSFRVSLFIDLGFP